ncbi:mobile mystery protein A [Inquilinus sp. OTU3971]|uniref:mobile mystery protein A n=1 Tax=Inquilinus sp. OTU3971 TaxID=3043855 RepID=UPI00313C56F4
MSVSEAATKQYQAIVNRAAALIGQQPNLPNEGWMATARKALGMSAAQLARRLGVTRARVSQAERAELSGGVTLKTMQATAEAMGCRFVYAIVPIEGQVEDIVAAQARRRAQALVGRAAVHMALERQSLPDRKNKGEVERIAGELIRTMPADFWADK